MVSRQNVQQYSFSSGMFDDVMEARADIKKYYSAGRDLTNFVGLPTGGVDIRQGLPFVALFNGTAKMFPFEFSDDQSYLIIFSNALISIYRNDVLQATVVSPYSAADLAEIDCDQQLDTMLIAHSSYQPKKLVRQGSHTAWALSDVELENPPQYEFSDTTGGTNARQVLNFYGLDTTDVFKIKLDGIRSNKAIKVDGTISDTAARMTDVAAQIQTQLRTYDFTSDTGITCTLTSGSSADPVKIQVDFTGDDGNQKWEEISYSLERDGYTTFEFFCDVEEEGEEPHENAWSATRGYPGTTAFVSGRWALGGSTLLPTGVWTSKTGDYFNFETTDDLLDDEAATAFLNGGGGGVPNVKQIYALNDILIFTSVGIFVTTESPITPKNFVPMRHSEQGCANIKPVEMDGAILFVAKSSEGSKQAIYEMYYDDVAGKYEPDDISMFSSSLIREPVAMAARRANSSNSANHVFVVNSDGTLAVLNTRRKQELNAWTICETDGKFKDVCVVAGETYFLVEREIGGATKQFIEKFSSENLLDCGVLQSSETEQTVWSGFGHLEGETVDVIGDGRDLGTAVVSGGQITLDYPVTTLEAGFAFNWRCEIMPVMAELSNGSVVNERHRIVRSTWHLKNTIALKVEGKNVPFEQFDVSNFDEEISGYSGLKTCRHLGWKGGRSGDVATVAAEGNSKGRATILSVTVEVAG